MIGLFLHCHEEHHCGPAQTVWFFVAILVSFCFPLRSEAREFTYKGINYTVTDENARTCCTKAGGEINKDAIDFVPGSVVEGDVTVPSVVCDASNRTYSVTGIGAYSFCSNRSLKSISLPETLAYIGNNAFQSCTNLVSISIPESVESIGECAFSCCESLSSVRLPQSLKSLPGGCFYYCEQLKNIEFPKCLERIEDCAANRHLSFKYPGEYYTDEEGTFEVCGLKSVELPGSLKYIGSEAFSSGLFRRIEIPESVTEIGELAFAQCENLESLTLPQSLRRIPSWIILGCDNLESIDLPAALEYIDNDAFMSSGLNSIVIPESVKEMGSGVFTFCFNLETIKILSPDVVMDYHCFVASMFYSLKQVWYLTDHPATCSPTSFSDGNYKNAVLYVAEGGLEVARHTEPWMYFDHIEELTADVERVASESNDVSTEIYRMDGVKISDSADGLPSGLYIVRNGGNASKIMVP